MTCRSQQIISDLYSQDFGDLRSYPVTTVFTEVAAVSPAEMTKVLDVQIAISTNAYRS